MEVTKIWQLYERGKDYLNKENIYTNTDKYHDFYLGNQWRGMTDADELPVINIIQPTVDYKISTVAQNAMQIVYSPMGGFDASQRPAYLMACEQLNQFAATQWEKHKMDTKVWDIIKDACISGDSYIFFYDGEGRNQIIDRTNIYFGDEQQTDIQLQPYILIYERRLVDDVKKEAEQNGLDEGVISQIQSDEDTENQLGTKTEVKTDSGKCSCLLYINKNKDGVVTVSRSTKTVIYQPETAIVAQDSEGNTLAPLRVYPIAKLVWKSKKGTCRGHSEVAQMLANQVLINKSVARREEAVKLFAFPKMVYDSDLVSDTSKLSTAAAKIGVRRANGGKVSDLISYINPAPISADAKNITDELIERTRELAGAGDAATGQINPEQASGAAIAAAVAQAQLPLNEQIAYYRQFIEDIALIQFALWVSYNPNGLQVEYEDAGEPVSDIIPAEILSKMQVNIRVDVSPNTPQAQLAQDTELKSLMTANMISFDEFVDALDDKSFIPKAKLETILMERRERGNQGGLMPEMQDPNAMLQQGNPLEGQLAV